MLDIGFLEMATIGIVALVVIGPERLPAVAAKVGRFVGKAQKFVRGVRSDISRELETGDLKQLIGDQKNQIDELRQIVNTATKDIQSSTKESLKGVEDSMSDLKSSVNDSASENNEPASTASTSLTDESSAQTTAAESDPELLNEPGVANPSVADDTHVASGDDASQQSNKAS